MKSKIQFNANHLKLIAIIAMTIDHVADLIFPGFTTDPMSIVMHLIGRLTTPMKWFFYIYYPLHLIIVGIIRILMYGNVPLLF